MASNPYVNKVIYGNDTVMDISDSTADENDVAEGEIFYKANGARSVGTASSNYYSPTDATSTDIDDADYIPFYDNSASAKKNSLWSTIKAKLNEIFFRRSEANVLGAKNLLPNNAVSTEYNGITYTVNADGTVTVNGSTSSSSSMLKMCELSLTAGDKYIVSGGYSSRVRINIYLKSNPSTEILVADTDYLWTVPATGTYAVQIYVSTNTSVTNALLKPMIRLGTDADSTYQPYAMTNKELTDKYEGLADVAISGAYSDLTGTPTLGSAAEKNVPASGDAGQAEVVLGSDTRLTDARTPTSHTHTTSQITDFPTLATVATSGSYDDLVDEPTNQSAQQFSSTVSLCTRNEKYLWNYAYNSALKWFSANALTGATSVIITVGSFSDYGLNGDIVAMLADDGTTKPVKYKTATAEEGSGGSPDYVEITFSALARNTDFKVGLI